MRGGVGYDGGVCGFSADVKTREIASDTRGLATRLCLIRYNTLAMSLVPCRNLVIISVEQYHSMIQTGVLTDDDPVELLEGMLLLKGPKNPPRQYVVQTAQEAIRTMLPAGWIYQPQDPITLKDGEPEPDGAVVRGSRGDYRTRHPGPADIALVMEVADSTLARDRGIKLRSYARAGIANYWIINLIDRCIEDYSRPDAAQAEPVYLDREIRRESESVSLRIGETECGTISVKSLLP